MARSISELETKERQLLKAIEDTERAIDTAANNEQVKLLNRRLAGLEQRIDDVRQQIEAQGGK